MKMLNMYEKIIYLQNVIGPYWALNMDDLSIFFHKMDTKLAHPPEIFCSTCCQVHFVWQSGASI